MARASVGGGGGMGEYFHGGNRQSGAPAGELAVREWCWRRMSKTVKWES